MHLIYPDMFLLRIYRVPGDGAEWIRLKQSVFGILTDFTLTFGYMLEFFHYFVD
jgi:hypothetical protein